MNELAKRNYKNYRLTADATEREQLFTLTTEFVKIVNSGPGIAVIGFKTPDDRDVTLFSTNKDIYVGVNGTHQDDIKAESLFYQASGIGLSAALAVYTSW